MMSRTFDVRQYRLLLNLLRTLGSRRELTSQLGFNAPAVTVLAGFALLLGGLVALVIGSERPPVSSALIVCLAITSVLLVPLLVSEAADALLNPAEISVLAHRPVGNLTYLAAKITYVVGFALAIALALNLVPAFAGLLLDGTAWFYPATHLVAAALTAAVTALATCGVFGLVFRVAPVAKVRSVALWAQLVGVTLIPLSPHVIQLVSIRLDVGARWWSAVPLTWFAAVGLAGQDGGPPLDPLVALPAMALTAGLIVVGTRALTRDYMTRVSTVLRSRRPRAARRRWLRRNGPVRWLTGGAQGYGAAAFVAKMAMRDWQFRREFLRSAVAPVILLAVFAAQRGARSPFGSAGFSTAHAIPHIVGIVLMATCQFLAFSDHYRARWIFLTVPASGMRGVVRGTVSALWIGGVATSTVAILAFGSIAWGVMDAAVFALYSLAVGSLYLGLTAWLQGGLPFTRPPNPARATSAAGISLVFIAAGTVFAIVQAFLIFPRVPVVLMCTLVIGAAAWLATQASLRVLETRVPGALRSFTESSQRTFGIVNDDA